MTTTDERTSKQTLKQKFKPYSLIVITSLVFILFLSFVNASIFYNLSSVATSCNGTYYPYDAGGAENDWNCTNLYDGDVSGDSGDIKFNTTLTNPIYIQINLDNTYFSVYNYSVKTNGNWEATNMNYQPNQTTLLVNNQNAINLNDPVIASSCSSTGVGTALLNDTRYVDSNGFNKIILKFTESLNDACSVPLYTIFETDLIVSNFGNSSNQQPYFNVSPEKAYYCIRENETFPVNINLNWSINDIEGDTIYYSTTKRTEISVDTTYDFIKTKYCIGSLCYITPDYNFLNIVYESGSNCQVADDFLISDNDYFYLLQGYGMYDQKDMLLYLNNNCNGTDKSLYFRLIEPTNDFLFSNTILELDVNESFNITYYDNTFNEIFIKVGIEKNESGVYIYNYNTTKTLLTTINTIENFKIDIAGINDLTYGIALYNGTTRIYLQDNIGMYQDNTGLVYYQAITLGNNTDLFLEKFYNTYVGITPEFTTSQPQYVEGYSTGLNYVNVYVKDSEHDTYIKETINVKIDQSDYCYNETSYEFLDNIIGNPMSNFFNYMGIKKYRNVIYILWVLMAVMLMIGNFKVRGNIDLWISALVSSLICFGVSFIIRDVPSMIVFLIIITFSGIFVARGQQQ